MNPQPVLGGCCVLALLQGAHRVLVMKVKYQTQLLDCLLDISSDGTSSSTCPELFAPNLFSLICSPANALNISRWDTVFPFAQLRYAKIILDSLLSHTPIYHGKGNSNPLQYSCLGNPMDRGARWATVLGVAKSQTRQGD